MRCGGPASCTSNSIATRACLSALLREPGAFCSGDYEEILNKVSALSMPSNAVRVWNTIHIAEIMRSLEARGDVVTRADMARVSPLADAYVIPGGTYRFHSEDAGSAREEQISARQGTLPPSLERTGGSGHVKNVRACAQNT